MKILVISPTYNEAANVGKLIDEINKLNIKNLDILIIDDNSPDGTSKIVKKYKQNFSNIFMINRKSKLGLGTAYCKGFKWAMDNSYDYVIQIDADLSHSPLEIPKMLEKCKKFDLVIGSRYINGVNVVNWPLNRLILSYLANIYAKIFTGLEINDLTAGFKCFKIEVLKSIDLDKIKSEGYSFQIEMNFLSKCNGFNIVEHPIIFHERIGGQSKMNKKIILEALFMVPKFFIKRIFKKFK